MAQYNFDTTLTSIKGHKIEIDSKEKYGAWERPDGSEGGGLWFAYAEDAGPLILELIDYDGTSVISPSIIKALRDHGIVVDDSFM